MTHLICEIESSDILQDVLLFGKEDGITVRFSSARETSAGTCHLALEDHVTIQRQGHVTYTAVRMNPGGKKRGQH